MKWKRFSKEKPTKDKKYIISHQERRTSWNEANWINSLQSFKDTSSPDSHGPHIFQDPIWWLEIKL